MMSHRVYIKLLISDRSYLYLIDKTNVYNFTLRDLGDADYDMTEMIPVETELELGNFCKFFNVAFIVAVAYFDYIISKALLQPHEVTVFTSPSLGVSTK